MSYPVDNTDFREENRTCYTAQDDGEETTARDLSKVETTHDQHLPILDSIQEALGKEVRKFQEMREMSLLLCNVDSDNGNGVMADSSARIHADGKMQHSSSISLTHKLKYLEEKLEETRAIVEVKNSEISDLKAAVGYTTKSPAIELQQDRCREMEVGLEVLFLKNIEAEIVHLGVSGAISNWRVSAAGNQIRLFEEQKNLATKQACILQKLGKAESEAAMVRKRFEKLESRVIKVQIGKVGACFLIQLFLALLVFRLFALQLWPHHVGVVPT